MSGHQYIPNNGGSLWEDDDIDDDTFLQNAPGGGGSGRSELDQIQAKRVEIEQRTLSSTNRSLGLLHETEQCGIATAEELAKQREQLENTNKQLDEINTTLRFSQKHLNGLKSVFGGLKNYLSGQKNQPPPPSATGRGATSPGASSNGMGNAASSPTDNSYEAHPVSRLRGDVQSYEQKSPSGDHFNQQLENNLDLMAGSISRLKGLAIDLNTDIDSQNELIDTITNKVEDVDVKIQRQNRDMNKLLGKK